MHVSFSAPLVPGWDVHCDDGTMVARRRGALSEYQRAWGAVGEVSARVAEELVVLCDAQSRLAERLATAEACHPKVEPFAKVEPFRDRV